MIQLFNSSSVKIGKKTVSSPHMQSLDKTSLSVSPYRHSALESSLEQKALRHLQDLLKLPRKLSLFFSAFLVLLYNKFISTTLFSHFFHYRYKYITKLCDFAISFFYCDGHLSLCYITFSFFSEQNKADCTNRHQNRIIQIWYNFKRCKCC